MRRRRGGDPRGAYPGVGAADGGLHGCDGPRSDRRGPCSHPSTTLIRCEERPRRPWEAGHETRADPTPHDRAVRARAEIARARTLVGSSLRSWGLEDEASALELAVSELVTNAFVHGHGDILVHLRADGGVVRLDVSDKGGDAPVPAVRELRSGERGGWGLLLLDELSDAWGAVTGPSETRVWMVKAASPGGATGDGDDL
jgi:anti-sigma regulatory factor (Ser/Thr protein kinase)